MPLDQLALSPQCGFSSTVHGNNIAVEDQRTKMRLVIDQIRGLAVNDALASFYAATVELGVENQVTTFTGLP